MNTQNGIEPVADWMKQYHHSASDCGCGCGDFNPCPTPPPCPCPDEGDIDSDTLWNQMQQSIAELDRIIKPLDLPEATKFQIIHLATCNIRACMNLLKLIRENQRAIAALNEGLVQTNGKVETNINDIAGIKGDIGTINTKLATLDQKHNNQQTQINDNASAINRLRHDKVSHCEFEKVASTVACNYHAINNLETTVANNKVTVDNALNEMSTKVSGLDKDVERLSGEVNTIKAVVTPAKISAMDEAIAENAKGIELVKGALNNTNTDVRKLCGVVEAHEVKIKRITEDHVGMTSQIAQNKAGVEDNRGKIVANTAAIETLIATDNQHGTDIATLKVRIDNTGVDAKQALDEVAALKESTEFDVKNLKDAVGKHNTIILQNIAKIDAVTEKANGMDVRLEETQTIAEDAKAAVDEMKPKVDANVESLKTLNETVITVNQNMADGFENINKNVADGFNTINGGIDNEIRPAINANAATIAEHTTQIGDLQTRVDNNTNGIEKAEDAVKMEETRATAAETELSSRVKVLEAKS